jgi:hypothetical protein
MHAYERSLRPCIALADRTLIDDRHRARTPSHPEVDKAQGHGHTQRAMTRAKAVELRPPVAVQLLLLGLVILSIFVILPR